MLFSIVALSPSSFILKMNSTPITGRTETSLAVDFGLRVSWQPCLSLVCMNVQWSKDFPYNLLSVFLPSRLTHTLFK